MLKIPKEGWDLLAWFVNDLPFIGPQIFNGWTLTLCRESYTEKVRLKSANYKKKLDIHCPAHEPRSGMHILQIEQKGSSHDPMHFIPAFYMSVLKQMPCSHCQTRRESL